MRPQTREIGSDIVHVKQIPIGNNRMMEGLFAKRLIPAYTILGKYPGPRFDEDQYERILDEIEEYYKAHPNMRSFTGTEYAFAAPDGEHVILPIYRANSKILGKEPGKLMHQYRNNPLPFVNEPSVGTHNSTFATYDNDVALVTLEDIKSGEEIRACYGGKYELGKSKRGYTTTCPKNLPGYVILEGNLCVKPRTRYRVESDIVFDEKCIPLKGVAISFPSSTEPFDWWHRSKEEKDSRQKKILSIQKSVGKKPASARKRRGGSRKRTRRKSRKSRKSRRRTKKRTRKHSR